MTLSIQFIKTKILLPSGGKSDEYLVVFGRSQSTQSNFGTKLHPLQDVVTFVDLKYVEVIRYKLYIYLYSLVTLMRS